MGDIAQDIKDYKTKAESLESIREDLVTKIKSAVINEIIPNLTPYLPEHYSISAEKSEVLSYSASTNSIPTTFQVNLRLLYNGKPIGIEGDNKLVGSIYPKLEPKLNEMAKKYGLAVIVLVGAPTH